MTFTFAKTAKAAAVAVVLGAISLSAVPAQAAGFSFNFGTPSFSFGMNDHRDHFNPAICLSERQIRSRIQEQGYRNVAVNVPNHNRLHVRATKGQWVYQLTVNACSGRILDRERLRRA